MCACDTLTHTLACFNSTPRAAHAIYTRQKKNTFDCAFSVGYTQSRGGFAYTPHTCVCVCVRGECGACGAVYTFYSRFSPVAAVVADIRLYRCKINVLGIWKVGVCVVFFAFIGWGGRGGWVTTQHIQHVNDAHNPFACAARVLSAVRAGCRINTFST